MTIHIEDYNQRWAEQFQHFKTVLEEILRHLHLVIEFIGSTAVPVLPAKPVIDVSVGLQAFSDLNRTILPMRENGFICLHYQIHHWQYDHRR